MTWVRRALMWTVAILLIGLGEGFRTNFTCPRCGGHHKRLLVHRFRRPVKLPNRTVTYWAWAICPTTLEPMWLTRAKYPQRRSNHLRLVEPPAKP